MGRRDGQLGHIAIIDANPMFLRMLGYPNRKTLLARRAAAKLVRHHQETWHGTGHPDGLKGEAIPLGARILAVVDAFGAITEARPFRAARTRAQAIAEIKRCAGTQFDPRVVEAFCTVVDQRNHVPRDRKRV